MFYILVFTGLAFFAFGVASTLLNSLKLQREYELISTELVRTDGSLRELEVKYDQSQNELKTFRLKIEASGTWTKDEINEAHGELEKLKAEYVRIKVSAQKEKVPDVEQVQEKCKRLLSETEEYNRLLAQRNEELGKLKTVFDGIKTQFEDSQKALAETHEQLKNIQPAADTHQRIEDVVAQLEDLRQDNRDAQDTQDIQEAQVEQDANEAPQKEDREDGIEIDRDNAEEINARKHLNTMKSFLSSLDNKFKEEKDKMEDFDTEDGK